MGRSDAHEPAVRAAGGQRPRAGDGANDTDDTGAPRRWRRSAWAVAVLLGSLALHALLLAWIEVEFGAHSGPSARERTVSVALLKPPAPLAAGEAVAERPPKPPLAPAAKPRPRPKPPPLAAEPGVLAAAEPLIPQRIAPADEGLPVEEDEEDDAARAEGEASPASESAVATTASTATQAVPDARPAAKGEAEAEAEGERTSAGEATPARPPLFGTALGAPPTGRWQLRVHYGEYTESNVVATLEYSIEVEGDRYRMRTEGRAEGLTRLLYSGVLTQSSTGRLGVDGLQPGRYSEQRGKRAERWAQVDYGAREVSFSGGQRRPLVDGAQDRLTVLMQLSLLARAQPSRFVAGASIEIDEIGSSDIQKVRYAVHGDAVLETEQGPLRTIHLERIEPRRTDAPKVEVWLGYDHHLIPVRIRATDIGGRVLDQLLAR
jgi:hypothetical protein